MPFFISVIANIMLAKLYAMAAMWTLNSRDEIGSARVVTAPAHLDFPSSRGMSAGSMSAPGMPRCLHLDEIETTGSQSTRSISGSESIQPNFAEQRKTWEV
jgi:hypothetical protein